MFEVFTDWLDVTFGPGTAPYAELTALFLGLGFEVVPSRDSRRHLYRPPGARGTAEIRQTPFWDRVSVSGAVCAALRDAGAWAEFLTLLSDQPHKVTRLDAALDLALDGADLVGRMYEQYPAWVNLGRKSLATSVLLKARPDGRQTGTWYAGHRSSARLTARVYDKAWEVFCKTGAEVLPCGRIEITARKDYGATLHDAYAPAALFWEGAAPAILPLPADAPMRQDIPDMGWKSPPRSFDAAALLRRRVEALAELDALATVADSLGDGGRAYLVSLLRRRLDPDHKRPADSAAFAEAG